MPLLYNQSQGLTLVIPKPKYFVKMSTDQEEVNVSANNDAINEEPEIIPDELIIKTYELTLEELYTGKEINWPSETKALCGRCGGLGKVLQPYSYRRDSSCYACKGAGQKIIMRNLKFQIPPGAEDEYEREIKGIGIPPKNILIRIRQKEHPYFVREGSDLFISLQISFIETLCGFQKVVKMLDGRKLVFSPTQGTVTSPNCVKCVENEGFPVRGKPCYKGKLYVQFKVDPPKLAPEIAHKVAEILALSEEESSDKKGDLDGIEVQLQQIAAF